MTNDEFDRKAEFLLNQQARFDADIQKLKEAQAATGQTVAQTTKTVAQTAKNLDHLTSVVDQLVTVTHEGFRFVIESFKDTNAKINALIDSQILTNERLDRHINEGHAGT
jgi:hypothetical protein